MLNKTTVSKMKKDELIVLVMNLQQEVAKYEYKVNGLEEQLEKYKEIAKNTVNKKDKEITRLNVKIGALEEQLEDMNSAITVSEEDTEYVADTKEALSNTLEEVAKELANEVDNNSTGVNDMSNVIGMSNEELNFFERTIESIVKFKARLVGNVLNAKYTDVPDALVESARSAIQGFLAKGKGKDITKDIEAFGRVQEYVDSKKEAIKGMGYNEEGELNMLGKLGAFIKAIIVKILKTLLATGKVIGKTAIVIGTLISKVVVFTLVEVMEAGKAILVISKDEYKKAILG